MKLNKWMYGAMAFGMLAACSDKDTPVYDGGTDKPGEPAKGYVAVNINLPQVSSTRANDNVEFNDGTEDEYAVKDATLYIFRTADGDMNEMNATLLSRHTLSKDLFAPTSPGNTQITASSVQAAEVDIDDDTDNLWALVILNKPDHIPSMTLPSDDGDPGTKFGEYLDKTAVAGKNFRGDDKYIFMVNAPLSVNPGGPKNPMVITSGSETRKYEGYTLTYLGNAKDAVQATEVEARANPAGCIYVERAVAKVTAKQNANVLTGTDMKLVTFDDDGNEVVTAFDDKDFKVEVSSMLGLQNISQESYYIRRVDGFPESTDLTKTSHFGWDFASTNFIQGVYATAYYRMVGETAMPALYSPMHLEKQERYRTYWARDPYYNDDAADDKPGSKYFANTADDGFVKADGTPLYIKENTFDVKHMKYGYTTLAVFKVTFKVNGAENLYILNGDHHRIYKSSKDAASDLYTYIWQQEHFKDAVLASVKEGVTGDIPDMQTFVKIEFTTGAGEMQVTGIVLDEEADNFENYFAKTTSNATFQQKLKDNSLDNLPQRLNNNFTIERYADGVSYYQVPIMHFGDASTPWKADGNNQSTTQETYGAPDLTRSKNFLGRYGIVRNNWYELNLNVLTAIGSPTMPEIEGNLSDDNNKVVKYIGVETHILSWAKRNQGVGF